MVFHQSLKENLAHLLKGRSRNLSLLVYVMKLTHWRFCLEINDKVIKEKEKNLLEMLVAKL